MNSGRSVRSTSLLLVAVFFANGAALGSWFSRIPQVMDVLELSKAELGLGLIGMPIGNVFAMVLASIVISRLGAARTMFIATVLVGCVAVAPALAGDMWGLILATFFMGIANGSQDIAMNASVSAHEQHEGVRLMSRAHAGFSLGALSGAVGGALSFWVGLGTFHHLALMGGAVALFALAAHRPLTNAVAAHQTGPLFAVPSRALVLLAVLAFGAFFAEGVIADWSAVWIREALGSSDWAAPLGFAAFSATMVIGRLSGDFVTGRIGDRRTLLIGALLATLGLGLGVVVATPSAAIIGLTISGLGLATMVPILFSRAGAVPGMASASAIAAVAGVGYGGFLISPVVIGFIAQATGLTTSFGLVAGLVAAMGITVLIAMAPDRR